MTAHDAGDLGGAMNEGKPSVSEMFGALARELAKLPGIQALAYLKLTYNLRRSRRVRAHRRWAYTSIVDWVEVKQ